MTQTISICHTKQLITDLKKSAGKRNGRFLSFLIVGEFFGGNNRWEPSNLGVTQPDYQRLSETIDFCIVLNT